MYNEDGGRWDGMKGAAEREWENKEILLFVCLLMLITEIK